MPKCSLNLAHPKFKKLIEKHSQGRPNFQRVLEALGTSVLKDRKLCGWVNHPMPGFPQYQNRVWKWDFEADEGAQSTGRKGWRLFALAHGDGVSDHPMPADAFFCYDKSQEPSGNPVTWIVKELKRFLTDESTVPCSTEERFRRVLQGDGNTRSLCMTCCETVAVTGEEPELSLAETLHVCLISN